MLILPGILTKFTLLKDGTYNVTFETSELEPSQVLGLAERSRKPGFVSFKEGAFKQSELDQIDNLEVRYDDPTKTPSKRLRNVLYIAWTQDKEGYEDFDNYYTSKMGKFIDHIKKKLDG